MKKLIAVLLLCGAVFPSVGAEEGRPQIAYRILTDHLTSLKDDSGRKIGGALTMGLGFTLSLASVGAFVWGDDISAAVNDESWDETTKYIVSGSLLGSGLIATGIGAGILFSKPQDPFSQFASIINEDDPVVQEALAVAALRDLAQEGKDGRIMKGIFSISLPAVALGIAVITNAARGEEWSYNLTSVGVWQVGSMISGISNIFFEKSKGERAYEKYLAARDALFSSEQ